MKLVRERSLFDRRTFIYWLPQIAILAVAVTVAAPGSAHENRCSFVYSEALFDSRMAQLSQRYRLPPKTLESNPPRDPAIHLLVPNLQQFNTDSVSMPDPQKQGEEKPVSALKFTFSNHDEKVPPVITKPVTTRGFDPAQILGERLSLADEHFRLINVGDHQLQPDYQAINEQIEEVLRRSPQQNTYVPVLSAFWQAGYFLDSFQIQTSLLAMDNYRKLKPYLTNSDFKDMLENDFLAKADNDYLVLMKDTGKSILEMSNDEFKKNAAAGLRIVRSGYGWSVFPYFSIFRKSQRLPGMLPCLSRIQNAQKRVKVQRLIAGLEEKGLHVAEFSRINRFQNIPKPIMKMLYRRALERADDSHDPIDILIMENDEITREVFAELQFEELAKISDPDVTPSEFVMFLDRRSARYAKAVGDLRSQTSDVVSERLTSMPPEDQWQRWEFPWQNLKQDEPSP